MPEDEFLLIRTCFKVWINFKYLSQKKHVDKKCKCDHGDGTKNEHHQKLGRLSPEASFFQHSAVSVCEDHIEEEVKSKGSEEQESCDQSPCLILSDDQDGVEI